jgi:hypothetical protein
MIGVSSGVTTGMFGHGRTAGITRTSGILASRIFAVCGTVDGTDELDATGGVILPFVPSLTTCAAVDVDSSGVGAASVVGTVTDATSAVDRAGSLSAVKRPLRMVIRSRSDAPALPAPSYAFARRVWLPFATVVEFQTNFATALLNFATGVSSRRSSILLMPDSSNA